MPIYCYRTDDGEGVEIAMDIGEMLSRQNRDGSIVLDDGRIGRMDFYAMHGKRKHVEPYHAVSTSMAVRPDQIAETIEQDRYMGSMADEYRPDGKLVFRSRHKHDAYAKQRGFKNYDNYVGT